MSYHTTERDPGFWDRHYRLRALLLHLGIAR